MNLYPSPYSTYDLVNAELEGLSDGTASLINDQAEILKYINQASAMLSNECYRVFVPYIKSDMKQGYDKRIGYHLRLPDDLLSLTSVDDYSDTAISGASYDLLGASYDFNGMPYIYIDFAIDATIFATRNTTNLRARFTFNGIWGYSQRTYTNSWETVGTASAEIINSGVASISVADSSLYSIYDHLRIGTEFLRVTNLANATTLTVLRGVNGSTASQHDNGSSIDRWVVDSTIQLATTRLAGWLYQNRKSGSNTLVFGDGTVSVNSVPSIVAQAIHARRKTPMIEVV